MYRFKKARKLLCFVVALLLAVACLTGCQNSADTDKAGADDKLTWQDYATSKVDFSLAERQNHIRNAVEFGYLCIRK